jgi:N-acetylglucosaminyl-diphospho-decaprenol L-rhamnosyltransferase
VKFSVVTVNYKSWPYTSRCIESLHATGYEDFEVVVVNNDRETAPAMARPLRVIQNPENVGFARACNQGLLASRGELVVFINPDTLVEGDFFEGLERFFDDNPKAGLAGPRIVEAGGDLQLSARKELGFFSGLLGRTSLLTKLFPKSQLVRRFFPAAAELTGPTVVDWISGACMTVRRDTLREIGPMDERFFMYFEDADLCRRAREAGWLVYYLPRIEVLHHSGASSGNRTRAIWDLHKSAFLYHRKHGPHGPLSLYSLLVLAGLAARALLRVAASLAKSG